MSKHPLGGVWAYFRGNGFFISLFLFIFTFISSLTGEFSLSLSIYALAFLSYSIIYISNKHLPIRAATSRRKLEHALCAISILLFFSNPEVMNIKLASFYAINLISITYVYTLQALVILPLLACSALIIQLCLKTTRRSRKEIAIIVAASILFIAIIAAYYGIVVTRFTLTDEPLITFYSINATLHGLNPYSSSISQLLFSLSHKADITFTASNTIVGVLNYPALYLISSIPFYFISKPTISNIFTIDLQVQSMVFVALLLFAVAYVLREKVLARPIPWLIIFLSIGTITVASPTTSLMLAIIILAYAKIGWRRSWVLLGLAASLQEELWIPVLLLIIYSFMKYGKRRGAVALIGTCAVFLILNSYFMLLSPALFMHSVFDPVSGGIFPDSYALLGYSLAYYYPISLPSYTSLFILGILLAVAILIVTREKALIPVLSMIPFLLMDRSSATYFATFGLFSVVAIISYKKSDFIKFIGSSRNHLTNIRVALCSAILIVLLIAFLPATYHSAFASHFSINVTNQTLARRGNLTVYSFNLNYLSTAPRDLYLIVSTEEESNSLLSKPTIYGLGGDKVLPNALNCTGYPCAVNPNLIRLAAGKGTMRINASINTTSRIYVASAYIYNSSDVYISKEIYNFS